MSSNTWGQVLDNFFQISKRRATLSPFGKSWKIVINGYNQDMYDWSNNLLKNWDAVEFLDESTYIFENKADAEKFLLLFKLKWAQ